MSLKKKSKNRSIDREGGKMNRLVVMDSKDVGGAIIIDENVIKDLDLVLARNKEREVVGTISVLGDASNLGVIENIRKKARKWMKNGIDKYLRVFIVEGKEIKGINVDKYEYKILGLEEGFIVDFVESYDSAKGAEFNLVLKQKEGSVLGVLNATKSEVESFSVEQMRLASGFVEMTINEVRKSAGVM